MPDWCQALCPSKFKAERNAGAALISSFYSCHTCHKPPADKLPLVFYWPKPSPTASITVKRIQKRKQLAKGMGGVSNTALDQKPSLPGRTQGQNCYSRKVLSPEHRPPSTVSFPLGRTSAFQARCGISVRGRGRALVGGERNSSRHLFRWEPGTWESWCGSPG